MKKYKSIFESALDTQKNELNPNLFKKDKLLPQVKKYILDILYKWMQELSIDFEILNIILIGSSGSFRWTDSSDIDINVTVRNITDSEVLKILPNGNLLKGTNHPINFYVVTDNKAVDQSDNAYDIINDEWIKYPKRDDNIIDYSYIIEVVKIFTTSIDLKINELESDLKEIEYYNSLLEENNTDNKEIKNHIELKEKEILANKDSLKLMEYLIHSFRKEAFENKFFDFSINMSIESPNYSMNNLIWKLFENLKYPEKIRKYLL